jgi:hypothetical protein
MSRLYKQYRAQGDGQSAIYALAIAASMRARINKDGCGEEDFV